MKKEIDTLFEKAILCYTNKEFENAISILNIAVKAEPKNADIFEKLAMCYFHIGNLESCLIYLTKSQKLDPNNPFRYASRAFIKNGLGDVDGAIKDYEIAIHLDPKDAIAHNNLGLLQEKKGFEKQAKSSFKRADNLAENFFKNKEKLEAENDLETEQKKENNFGSKQTSIQNQEPGFSQLKTIQNVFNSKQGFIEFISFIKNGFKLKK